MTDVAQPEADTRTAPAEIDSQPTAFDCNICHEQAQVCAKAPSPKFLHMAYTSSPELQAYFLRCIRDRGYQASFRVLHP